MRYLALLILGMVSAALSATEPCRQVTISAHPNYPPFHWKQGETLTGASISVSSEILLSMGIEPVVVYAGPWKRVLKKAELGQIDLIPALKDTEERRSYLEFTRSPFYSNPVAIFTATEFNNTINSLTELNDLSGSINLGDKHGDPIDRFVLAHPKMQQVYSMKSNFEMLKLGRTDFFIQGLYAGKDFLYKAGLQDDIKVSKTFDANWVHNGFSKKSKCLHIIKEFDDKLAELLDSGYIEQKMNAFEELWLNSESR